MRKVSTIKYCSLAFYMLLLLVEIASSAPCSGNYESSEEPENLRGQEYQLKNRSLDVRDLYELLLKKQAMEEQLNQQRQMVRKSNRSPSLRLRFGKRKDSYITLALAERTLSCIYKTPMIGTWKNSKLMGGPYPFMEDLEN